MSMFAYNAVSRAIKRRQEAEKKAPASVSENVIEKKNEPAAQAKPLEPVKEKPEGKKESKSEPKEKKQLRDE